MDKFEEFVQKVGMATVTPEDLSWVVAYATTLRSHLQAVQREVMDSAKRHVEKVVAGGPHFCCLYDTALSVQAADEASKE